MCPMKLLILCAVAAVVGGEALAGGVDYGSVLRGSADTYVGELVAGPPRYVPAALPALGRLLFGGPLGRTGAGIEFGNGTSSLTSYILRNDVVGSHVASMTRHNRRLGTKKRCEATWE
jgi:hypothetical protein